ncbi:MAG: peptidase S9 [Acidobacteriota bacterium]
MRRSPIVRTVLSVALAALPAAAAGPPVTITAGEVPFEALFDETLQPKLSELTWNAEGTVLAGLWKEGERKGLKGFDGATGAELWTVFVDELREAGAGDDATDFPTLDAFAFRPASTDLLLTAGGDLWLWTPGSKQVRRLTTSPDDEEEYPELSPDGRRVAFSRAADLWVLELAGGRETRLTEDGRPDEILNGTADWVYWEEIWSRSAKAIWWSPNSLALAYYRFDEREVPSYPLTRESDAGAAATVKWQRYPKPGDPNPKVSLRVVEVDSQATVELATGHAPDDYLARVHWRGDAGVVAVERLNREQNRLDLLFCRPDVGSCTEVASQREAAWVNLADDFRFLADGGFLWSDESSGWRRLHRHDRLGRQIGDLLPAGWALDRLIEMVAPTGRAIVSAHPTGPLGAAGRQLLALDIEGRNPPEILTARDGWHDAVVAPATGAHVAEWSDQHTPVERRLVAADGRELATLPGGLELPVELATLPRWRILEIPGPEGSSLPAAVIEPGAGAAVGPRPVVTFHYGGPASQMVVDRWGGNRGLWLRWMASRGYLVLVVDNQASRYFGKRGEDRLHRRFGELELAGQLAGVEWLRARGDADVTRLGLWGWSGGGFNTLYSILHRPGVWRAAVAGAPVTDWRLYDSIWTERYLDSPADNPDGYRDSSPLGIADRLADALLVVHGTGDDNVHPQNSIALMKALVEADKPFEDAIYPDEKHGFKPGANRHFYRRMTDFFDRHLGAPR